MGLRKKRKYSWKISRGILNEKLKKANGFSEIEGEQKRNAGTTLIVKYVLRRSLIRSVKVTRERNVRREISIKRKKKRSSRLLVLSYLKYFLKLISDGHL